MRLPLLVGLGLLGAGQALAAPAPFPSVVGGTIAAPDQNVLEFGLGRTDALSVGWRTGMNTWLELGASLTGTWGYRGLLFITGDTRGGSLGAKAQARVRAKLVEVGWFSAALTFEPGVSLTRWQQFAGVLRTIDAVGVELPIALKLGFAVSARVTLGLRAEVPFFLELQNGALVPVDSLAYGPRFGLGVEVVVSQPLMLFFALRSNVLDFHHYVCIDGQVGLAWRLPSP